MRDVNPDIQEKRKQLQRKEVVISAFGRHNCGKSTLLNVIVRNRYYTLHAYYILASNVLGRVQLYIHKRVISTS